MKTTLLPSLCIAFYLGTGQLYAKPQCGRDEAGFGAWLSAFKKEAAAQGISDRTLSSALGGVQYSGYVISLDRSQRSFKLSFDAFWRLRVDQNMINKGRQLKKTHASLFGRIEKAYGVPAEILLAIWGLETGYGRNSGNLPILTSLASLAYDCRRSDFFTKELMSALRIVQRGDMKPSSMRGAWAGEIGQTQFMASSYEKYAIDFDGNGKRDLIHSIPDVLASTANFLKAHGWKRGASWNEGGPNNAVLREWNRAEVYRKTIAKMATAIKD